MRPMVNHSGKQENAAHQKETCPAQGKVQMSKEAFHRCRQIDIH